MVPPSDESLDGARSNEQTKRVLQAIAYALDRGRPQEAVRLFVRIVSDGPAPAGNRLVKWLVTGMGQDYARKLVEALVHFPCFYCKKGRMPCTACESRGEVATGVACARCIGIGHERCDFCNGSGWVTINYVPEGLRPAVIRSRALLAAERMKALLARPLPRPSPRNPIETVKQCNLLILNLDRQLGVFENMLIAARQLPESDRESRTRLEKAVKSCVDLAARGEERICVLVRCAAESTQLATHAQNVDPTNRKRLRRKASSLESLVDPDRTLSGTGIEHRFLHQFIKVNWSGRKP